MLVATTQPKELGDAGELRWRRRLVTRKTGMSPSIGASRADSFGRVVEEDEAVPEVASPEIGWPGTPAIDDDQTYGEHVGLGFHIEIEGEGEMGG
jgi:hypothetical protein